VAFHIIIFQTARNSPPSTELIPTIPSHNETLLSTPEHPVSPIAHSSVVSGGEPFEPTSSSMAGKSSGITEAILSSLVFATIAWGGLYIVWDKYNNVQKHRSEIGNRMYLTLELVLLCLAAPLVSIVILKAMDACVRLFRRVGRYQYNTLTSDVGSGVDDAVATGCPDEPIIIGVGVCTTDVAVLPMTSPHVRQQQHQQPLVDIGYNSLKGVEENVVNEMKRTNSCNGWSSGDTSVSSTTQSDVYMEQQRQRQQLLPDQVSTVTIDHFRSGGAHAHNNDDDHQHNITTCSTSVVTPSSNATITTTRGGVDIDHRRG